MKMGSTRVQQRKALQNQHKANRRANSNFISCVCLSLPRLCIIASRTLAAPPQMYTETRRDKLFREKNVLRHHVLSVHVRGETRRVQPADAGSSDIRVADTNSNQSLVSAPFILAKSQPRSAHVHARLKGG